MLAKSWWSVLLAGVAAVLGSIIGGNTPAVAASDNDPRTYAGYRGRITTWALSQLRQSRT